MANKKELVFGTKSSATHRSMYISGFTGSVKYIDIAKGLCSHNNRLYQQGRVYMANISVFKDASKSNIELNTIPNTWMIRKAWSKGFEQWLESRKPSIEQGAKVARWNDFRIGWQHDLTWADYLGAPPGFNYGDGEYLKSYVTNTISDTRYTINMFGGNTDGVNENGLLAMFDELAGVVSPDPNQTVTADPYQDWHASGHIDPAGLTPQDIQTVGDYPPYNPDALTGGTDVYNYHRIALNGEAPSSTGWVEVPCGLIQVVNAPENSVLKITVAPGDYKGVMAEHMDSDRR